MGTHATISSDRPCNLHRDFRLLRGVCRRSIDIYVFCREHLDIKTREVQRPPLAFALVAREVEKVDRSAVARAPAIEPASASEASNVLLAVVLGQADIKSTYHSVQPRSAIKRHDKISKRLTETRQATQ